jgi:WD40 repeat protein
VNRRGIESNPFPGLRPFEESDRIVFFGREQQADELLDRLAGSRFVAVVGTSASGKSSLVRAGLLPALHGGFMASAGSRWRTVTFRPGSDPIGALARELVATGVAAADLDDLALVVGLTRAVLERGEFGLVEVVQQAGLREDENVLLVVDQFEELFRFRQHRDDASAFVKLLLAAAASPDSIYVLITMRSDFLGECSQFRDLPEAINNGIFLVPRLTRDQLREAIEGPVGVAGAEISPVLVNRLLNELGDSPDQLPVLQHALMRTWEIWQRHDDPERPIDATDFDDTGGLRSALSHHGDETYNALAPELQPIAERIFKALTDSGSDHRGIRRPTAFDDLVAIVGASAQDVGTVVEVFRAPGVSFLMPPADKPLSDTTVIDISHESLMRVWERLRHWVDEEALATQEYRRLSDAAERHARGVAALLIDPELTLATKWRLEQKPTPAWAAHALATSEKTPAELEAGYIRAIAFLDASIKARDDQARDRELAEQRERTAERERLEAASALALERTRADAARRIERRSRVAALVLLLLALVATGAGAFAQWQNGRAHVAESKARDAESKERDALGRVTVAMTIANNNAVSANRSARYAKSEEKIALDARAAALASANRAIAAEASARADAATLSKQKALLAVKEQQVEALERASETQRERVFLEAGRRALVDEGNVNDAALYLGAAYRLEPQDQDVQILLPQALQDLAMRRAAGATPSNDVAVPDASLADADRAQILPLQCDPAVNRRVFAIGYPTGDVVLWDQAGTQREALRPFGSTEAVTALNWDPSGRYLAAGGDAGSAAIVDTDAAAHGAARRLDLQQGRVSTVAFSADGSHLVTVGADGTVVIWDNASGKPLRSWNVDASGAVFAGPSSAAVVVAQSNGTLSRWNWQDDTKRAIAGGWGTSPFVHIASVSGGRDVAAANADGTVVLYDAVAGSVVATITDSRSPIDAIAFDPAGRRIITARRNGTAHVYDVNGHGVAVLTQRGGVSVVGVAIDRDDTMALTTYSDGSLAIWTLYGQQEIAHFRGFPGADGTIGAVRSAGFSPDGKTIAVATDRGVVTLAPGDWLLARTDSGAGAVESLTYDASGSYLLSTHAGGEAVVWRSNAELQRVSSLDHAPGSGPVFAGQFSHDGRQILTVSGTAARVWSFAGGVTRPERTFVPAATKRFTQAMFALDDRAVMTLQNRATPLDSNDYNQNRWFIRDLNGNRTQQEDSYWSNPRTFELTSDGRYALEFKPEELSTAFRQLPSGQIVPAGRGGGGHSWADITAVSLAHDYRRNGYALGADGGAVSLIAFDGSRRRIGFPNQGDVGVLAYSDDDRWLGASGRSDKTVKIIDTGTVRQHALLRGPTSDVRSIVFSPHGGALVLTVNVDGAARLWNRDTGALLGIRWLPGATVTAAAFDPARNRLLLGGSNGAVYTWSYRVPVSPAELQTLVRAVDTTNPEHVCLLDQAIQAIRSQSTPRSAVQCE